MHQLNLDYFDINYHGSYQRLLLHCEEELKANLEKFGQRKIWSSVTIELKVDGNSSDVFKS